MSSSPKSAMGALKPLWRLEKAFAKYFIKRVLLDLLLSLFCWTELSYAFGWFDRVPDDVNVGVLLCRASLWPLMFYLIRWLRAETDPEADNRSGRDHWLPKPRTCVEFHGVQQQSSSSVRAGEGGGPVVVQAAQPAERVIERCVDGETLKSIDGIKEGEALNDNCGDVEGTLQPNQISQLISDFNRALNEFETKKKSIHIGNPSTLPFTELIGNKSEGHIWDLPGGLVMTHEFGSVNMVNIPDKEESTTTTMKGNELDQSDQPPHRAI
nr:hypothetical protein CFP56_40013 [Quercus suber]